MVKNKQITPLATRITTKYSTLDHEIVVRVSNQRLSNVLSGYVVVAIIVF